MLILAAGVLLFAANAPASAQQGKNVRFEIIRIPTADLPLQVDENRTFFYKYNSANAESLLTVLTSAGIRFVRAWQPLDDRCMNPVGPRLTVQLLSDDERVLAYGFARGVGRLRCSSELLQITPAH